MTIYYLLGFVLSVIGVVLILDITPEYVTETVFKKLFRKPTLAQMARDLENGKKKKKLKNELQRIRSAMAVMGKEKLFTILIALSLVMLIGGCVTAIVIGNPFLMPVLASAFALLPIAYARKAIDDYDRQIREELETALSIITTSYVRNDDIVQAVKENSEYLRPPVKNLFDEFVLKCLYFSADMKANIRDLKSGIRDAIFAEWCDTLILCQDDRNLKDTLMPIVAKYTDERIVNNELKGMMAAARWEYYMMAGMVLVNIPLLKMINEEWYKALTDTIQGKLVLGICAATILITAILMMKYTKPVGFGKAGEHD